MLLLRMGSCPKLQVRRISKGILAIQIQIQRNSQEQHPTASTKWKWQVHICLLPLFMYKCISNKNDLIDSTNRHDSSKRPSPPHHALYPSVKNPTRWHSSSLCVDICQLARHSEPIKNVSDSSMKYATISYAVFFATWTGIPILGWTRRMEWNGKGWSKI